MEQLLNADCAEDVDGCGDGDAAAGNVANGDWHAAFVDSLVVAFAGIPGIADVAHFGTSENSSLVGTYA